MISNTPKETCYIRLKRCIPSIKRHLWYTSKETCYIHQKRPVIYIKRDVSHPSKETYDTDSRHFHPSSNHTSHHRNSKTDLTPSRRHTWLWRRRCVCIVCIWSYTCNYHVVEEEVGIWCIPGVYVFAHILVYSCADITLVHSFSDITPVYS